jgi:hypothetical protein
MLHEKEQKRILIERLVPYLPNPSTAAINELLQQPLADLEVMLDRLSTEKAQRDANETVEAHRAEMRRESALDAAYTSAIRNVTLNGRYLTDSEANRNMLESLLNPGEDPSPAIYRTLALQFSTKFSWEFPKLQPTNEDREAEFVTVCHDNLLSLCDANRQMFKDGVALENFAGMSGVERAALQAQQAQERQTFLIKNASPSELRNEAQYQSTTEREIALKAESDRQHAFVSQAQAGLYSPLPTHNQAGEIMDARYFRRLSTLDYPLFRQLVKKFGTAQITERLRTPAAAPAAL